MSNEEVTVHYVMILDVKKITKVRTKTNAYHTTPASDTTYRSEDEVIKLVIRDSDLDKLVVRGVKHLELAADNVEHGTETLVIKPKAR